MRTTVKRALGGGAAVALSLTTALATAQPAAADSTTFNDGGGHLTTVTVDNTYGPEDIRVKAKVGDYNSGSHFSFWIDTDSENAGPEYRIKVYPNSEVLPIQSVESFAGTGTNIDCDYRASADAGGSKYVTIKIPRDCLGSPDRIRVSVRANYSVPGPNVVDWGPGRKQFFSWVWWG
jgi:hypothetical protein